MMLKMFCVYDKAVGAYMNPFFVRSSGEAIRAFTDEVNTPKSGFNSHPADFILFSVGTFDPATAQFTCEVTHVIDALSVSGKM